MLLFLATLSLPILLGIISFLFYRDKVTNQELLALFGVSIFSFSIMFFVMRENNVSDERFYSREVVDIRYYEPWNEYIHKTCSRTRCTGSGKSRRCYTTYYDCSYVKNHSEKWVKRTSERELDINEGEYNKILALWGKKRVFVDMNRHYHSIDGDAYQTNWDRDLRTSEVATFTENYENRTLTASTIFNHKPFDPEDVKKKGLFEYPKLYDYNQNVILNHPSLPDHVRRYYNNLNALNSNYRVFILYFKNKPRNIAFEQKRHWQGGNDNELVICVGIGAKNEVKWVEPFSWAKKPILEAKVKRFYSENPDFNLEKLYPSIKQWLKVDWKKRDFHDFDYIDIELTEKQVYALWIVLSLINVAFTIYIIKNEFNR